MDAPAQPDLAPDLSGPAFPVAARHGPDLHQFAMMATAGLMGTPQDLGGGDGGGETLAFAFKCTLTNATTITVSGGRCRHVNPYEIAYTAWTDKAEAALTITGTAGKVYVSYDFETQAWTGPAFGTPPSESATLYVKVLADYSEDSGLVQWHFGDVEMYRLVPVGEQHQVLAVDLDSTRKILVVDDVRARGIYNPP